MECIDISFSKYRIRWKLAVCRVVLIISRMVATSIFSRRAAVKAPWSFITYLVKIWNCPRVIEPVKTTTATSGIGITVMLVCQKEWSLSCYFQRFIFQVCGRISAFIASNFINLCSHNLYKTKDKVVKAAIFFPHPLQRHIGKKKRWKREKARIYQKFNLCVTDRHTDRQTDRPIDGLTNRQIHPLIEMQECIFKEEKSNNVILVIIDYSLQWNRALPHPLLTKSH